MPIRASTPSEASCYIRWQATARSRGIKLYVRSKSVENRLASVLSYAKLSLADLLIGRHQSSIKTFPDVILPGRSQSGVWPPGRLMSISDFMTSGLGFMSITFDME